MKCHPMAHAKHAHATHTHTHTHTSCNATADRRYSVMIEYLSFLTKDNEQVAKISTSTAACSCGQQSCLFSFSIELGRLRASVHLGCHLECQFLLSHYCFQIQCDTVRISERYKKEFIRSNVSKMTITPPPPPLDPERLYLVKYFTTQNCNYRDHD